MGSVQPNPSTPTRPCGEEPETFSEPRHPAFPHTSSLLLWGTLRGHLSVIDTPSVKRAEITIQVVFIQLVQGRCTGALFCGHELWSEVHFHPFPQISEVLWFGFFASLPSSSTGHVPHPLICQDSSRAQRILLKAQVL